METCVNGGNAGLVPPVYLESLAGLLESAEREAWDWIAGDLAGPEHAERVRLEILKSTFRIDRDTKPGLYETAALAASRLGLAARATFYQVQQSTGMNAGLFFIPGEIHVAFSGPVLEKLGGAETAALIGHEAGHFMLLEGWGRRYRVLEDVMAALAADPGRRPVHDESLRLMRLHTEAFCDRASLIACGGDLAAAVGSIVKIETGVADVPAESYLRQIDEIFDRDDPGSRGQSHPEAFIRARALSLWAAGAPGAEEQIRRMIEGTPAIGRMSLPGQMEMVRHTRAVVDALLSEKWMRSETALAHARMFFDGYAPPAAAPDLGAVKAALSPWDEDTARYFAYVLLDFAACDREIEEPALAASILASRALGMGEPFREQAMKELGIGKRRFEALEEGCTAILDAARKGTEQSP